MIHRATYRCLNSFCLNGFCLIIVATAVLNSASNSVYAQNWPSLNNPGQIQTEHAPTISTVPPVYQNLQRQPERAAAPNQLTQSNQLTQTNQLGQSSERFDPQALPDQLGQPASYPNSATAAAAQPDDVMSDLISRGVESMGSRSGTANTVKAALLFGALSLAPAILLMTTCYIRVVVVLGLLRQAFGAQQLPPTQVLTALSLFVTILIMAPIWNQVKTDAIDPYVAPDSEMSWDEAWNAGVRPVKDFMSRQIDRSGNTKAIALFYNHASAGVSPGQKTELPSSYSEIPLNVILPAFVLSELKVAFLLGFQIYLPFLVLDLVVSSVTVSMGMLMLPPTMVSFPLKLILFVMVDGWNLVVGMLLQSFGPFG